MWIFLGSETLLFAGLFGLYASYRVEYPVEFADAIRHNTEWIGSVNTLVLITSSVCVAAAVAAIRMDRRRACLVALAGAMLLGLAFLGLKTIEYGEHFAEGIAPGHHYSSAELASVGANRFFTLYYAMTALHALHVIAGLAILAWVAIRVKRRRTTKERHVELELGGLYWHLVDIVWIFLWPLLYLTG
jgi:cytochrome c oxidase subunit 3